MAGWRGSTKPPARTAVGPVLAIADLDVYYGRAHALQGVSITIERGVTAIVGRNGMGKTTLCNAVTGLVRATGSVRLLGQEILGLAPNEITRRGIAYVPQGRRVWPSLTVDEHLRLAEGSAHRGVWTIERIYDLFPRLAERRGNGGYQLSGGEQQMLAIGRALLFNPRLLVMDEPTEGLAPVIVEQVAATLKSLGDDALSVLLVEQNLGVAIDVADTIAVMVNGRIARTMPAAELAADRDLQQRLLGVTTAGDVEEGIAAEEAAPAETETRIFTVRRANDDGAMPEQRDEVRAVRHQEASLGPSPVATGRREPVRNRELGDSIALNPECRVANDEQPAEASFSNRREGPIQIVVAAQ